MGIKIKPDTQKNFIIARVAVNESKLIGKLFSRDDTEIFIPMGYSLFYTRGAALERLKEEVEQTVNSVELVKQIKDRRATTLYWVRNSFDKNYEITVPWGIVFPQKSYNGQIKLKFDIERSLKCEFVSDWMCSCATEIKDGLNYEYLSEYYVDEKNEFQGLSITIRELLVSELKNCGENIEEIIGTIKSLARDLFERIGLLLDENSIGVIETKHLVEGGK